jgi:hypothetical protein
MGDISGGGKVRALNRASRRPPGIAGKSLTWINDHMSVVNKLCGEGSKERTKMTLRVSRTLVDFLLRDTKDNHNHEGEADPLQQEILEAYRIAIRRGLTPSDALAVAVACGTRRMSAAARSAHSEAHSKH